MLSSIVIPAFQKVDLLHECLERFHNQTCTDFEVVVVSDGCAEVEKFITDYDAPFELRSYNTNYEGFGVAVACNRGIYEAKGEQIIIIGPDCLVTPQFIKSYQNNFDYNTLLLGNIHCVELDEIGCIDYVCMTEYREIFNSLDLESKEFGLDYAWLTFSGNMSFSKLAALEIGGFDVSNFLNQGGSDTDFGRRHALQFGKIRFIHNPVYHVGLMSNISSKIRKTSIWNRTRLGELSNRKDAIVTFVWEV